MKTIEKQFDVGFQSTIDISVDKGNIKIWGWENSACKVIAESSEAMNFDFDLTNDYLQLELTKGQKEIQVYVPKHSKLMVDGSYLNSDISNLNGSLSLENGKGDIKISNLDGNAIIEMEHGNIELENINGTILVEKGKGTLKAFKVAGELKVESGHGNMELTSLNGECYVESGKGDIVVQEGKGNMNLYCGHGDLTLDYCTFKRLAAEGKGGTKIIVSSEQDGVWNILRNGDFNISAPVTSQLDFKVECRTLTNNIPGLNFTKYDDLYKGSLGFSPKGTVYIEGAKEAVFEKGNSQGYMDICSIDEDEKETLKILEMLKQGIITSDQAEELLSAIEGTSNLEEVE
ncbi:DUF4097 family beta strand repeat protein [Alkalicella caledoniensis]|uniref:DUF4097 family beta strand repeat protein n=1 Tax=Alkalicella caledoniensis TaxID=2731377 RepID=A0A7G9W6X4_ALKCA|nr:DUF4097 family beta strand repeat-containing protein [Alkalicella caledoniensis]QNO14436.1 DUF4097 family beta strand repeat protein [Alkalicella caledoniensis]